MIFDRMTFRSKEKIPSSRKMAGKDKKIFRNMTNISQARNQIVLVVRNLHFEKISSQFKRFLDFERYFE